MRGSKRMPSWNGGIIMMMIEDCYTLPGLITPQSKRVTEVQGYPMPQAVEQATSGPCKWLNGGDVRLLQNPSRSGFNGSFCSSDIYHTQLYNRKSNNSISLQANDAIPTTAITTETIQELLTITWLWTPLPEPLDPDEALGELADEEAGGLPDAALDAAGCSIVSWLLSTLLARLAVGVAADALDPEGAEPLDDTLDTAAYANVSCCCSSTVAGLTLGVAEDEALPELADPDVPVPDDDEEFDEACLECQLDMMRIHQSVQINSRCNKTTQSCFRIQSPLEQNLHRSLRPGLYPQRWHTFHW